MSSITQKTITSFEQIQAEFNHDFGDPNKPVRIEYKVRIDKSKKPGRKPTRYKGTFMLESSVIQRRKLSSDTFFRYLNSAKTKKILTQRQIESNLIRFKQANEANAKSFFGKSKLNLSTQSKVSRTVHNTLTKLVEEYNMRNGIGWVHIE